MEVIAGRKSFNIGYSPDTARRLIHTSVVTRSAVALQCIVIMNARLTMAVMMSV
jgi:hypothetical protein